MKKIYLGVTVTLMLLFLLASAMAFSISLQDLHINATSLGLPLASSVEAAAPMTYADEANLSAPQGDTVHFAEFDPTEHLCQRDKSDASRGGF